MTLTRQGEERLTVEADSGGHPLVFGGTIGLVDEQNRRAALVELHPDAGVAGGIRRARVLAAAPRMLAALRAVERHLDSERPAADVLIEVHAAIAEAEGRRPEDPSWDERQAGR